MSTSPRVLVTGAGGFIGRQALAPLVAQGADVHVAARRPGPGADPRHDRPGGAPVHVVDLLDDAAVGRVLTEVRPDVLLHFAWHDGSDRWTSPQNAAWSEATLNLAARFAAAGGHRLVVAGTCAEYDWQSPVLSEADTPIAPATPYGAAKARTHELLRARAAGWGLSLAWARVFFCYGPAEPAGRLIHDVITALLRGREVECSDGRQVRDYLHTADIGRAFAALAASSFDGAINVASGVGVAVRDVVDAAARGVGRPELVRFGARPRMAGEPERLVADTGRFERVVGLRPIFDLASGMQHTIAWYRSQVLSPSGERT